MYEITFKITYDDRQIDSSMLNHNILEMQGVKFVEEKSKKQIGEKK